MLSRISLSLLALSTLLVACDDEPQVMPRNTKPVAGIPAGNPAGMPAGETGEIGGIAGAGIDAGEQIAGVNMPVDHPCDSYVPSYSNGDPIDCSELSDEVRCAPGGAGTPPALDESNPSSS